MDFARTFYRSMARWRDAKALGRGPDAYARRHARKVVMRTVARTLRRVLRP